MASAITFRTTRGRDGEVFIREVTDALQPTSDDVLYALERQKTRILDRTAKHVDFDGRPFEPYSEKGPYYHDPYGSFTKGPGSKQFTVKQRSARAKRLQKKTGAGEVTRGGRLKFESYGAFKRSLGRSGVDLLLSSQMLKSLVTKVSGLEGVIGIYGDEADRARGHHDGIPGRLPQRRFLAASLTDARAMAEDLLARIQRRLKGK